MEPQFAFVEQYDKDLYGYLINVEKSARLRMDTCANNVRKALERLVNLAVERHNLKIKDLDKAYKEECKDFRDPTLGSRLRGVTDAKVLGRLHIKLPSLLPFSGEKFSLQQRDEKMNHYYTYVLLRMFGNAGSHTPQEEKEDTIALTFNNLTTCLKQMHKILRKFFDAKTTSFDANWMEIDNYEIDAVVPNPVDGEETKCMQEFYAHIQKGVYNVPTYAILRQYLRKDIEETLLTRNIDFSQLANRKRPYKGAVGIIPNIQRLDDGIGEFAIIAYEFRQKPERLKKILGTLSMKQRIRLCRDIAACFKDIHTGNPPLYHRFLTFESIYVCYFDTQEEPNWAPYLKFDFGKILVKDTSLTVEDDRRNAVERLKSQSLTKYIDKNACRRKDWERVDLYGLYVLFGDILQGKIGETVADISALEDMGYSGEVLDLLDDMSLTDGPNAKEIYQVLDGIVSED